MSISKRLLLALTVFCFLASACAPAMTALPVTPVAVSTATQTPQPLPTLTLTQPPTDIPATPTISPTPTRTPLPTIPTFTPTFDARTIVTATLAPKVCPKENPTLKVNLDLAKTRACFESLTIYDNSAQCVDRELQPKILDFLNQGGDINKIISELKTDDRQKWFIYQDLTNDQINDLVFRDADSPYNGYYFYTCSNATYKVQTFWDRDPYAYLMDIKPIRDLNANGIPEIVITAAGVLEALQWNGNDFEKVLRIDDGGLYEITDLKKNGLREIIQSREAPPHWNTWQEFPWRHYVSTYGWNGSTYVRISKVFDVPIYRFQAVQDADQYAIEGNNQKAISLYQDIIFNDKLEWWSPERRSYESEKYFSAYDEKKPTLSPKPDEDPFEYPKLAAYAYYRMVILHTHLGEADAAAIQYATLQDKFPAASPGHPYAKMASAFWQAYQSSQNMTDACGAAIQYAAEHPDILTVLGSDYHGSQSHTYLPADVCPFR